jgi:hypothetical protein
VRLFEIELIEDNGGARENDENRRDEEGSKLTLSVHNIVGGENRKKNQI